MKTENIMQAWNLKKRYKGFELSVPRLELPKGFATALIGENGAGKTTLLNILAGIRLDFQGEISYFGRQKKGIDESVQEDIGYRPGMLFPSPVDHRAGRRGQRPVILPVSCGQIP